MIERKFIFSSAWLLIGFSSILSLSAVTVTNFPVADAEIRESDPTNNVDTLTVVSGKPGDRDFGPRLIRRAFFRFDLSNIPANAIIRTAHVHVVVTKTPPAPANSTFELYRVLKNWNETQVTWISPSSLEVWTSPGASSRGNFATNDTLSSPSSTTAVTGNGTYTFVSTQPLVADIQLWVANSSANNGWLLESADETSLRTARHFGSRESATPPLLIVEFTVPAVSVSPLLTQMEKLGNLFQFRFVADPGAAYTVEKRENIAATNWIGFTNIPPQSGSNTVLISDPITRPQQFYRVKSP